MSEPVLIALISSATAIVGILLTWALTNFRVSLGGLRRRCYRWRHIEKGVDAICNQIEADGIKHYVLLTTHGSACVVAGLVKKKLEVGSEFRALSFSFLLESKDNNWVSDPIGHRKIESARFNIYVPEALEHLPPGYTIIIVDSVWITGDTIAKLRDHLGTFSPVKAYFLFEVLSHKPRNSGPDLSVYKSYNSDIVFPWGPAS